jgi:exosortase K
VDTGAKPPMSAYVSIALTALALKLGYSRATVGDLDWILRPTAGVVGWLSGQPLWRDPDLGWVAGDGGFVIAPACAGVNFLILIFALPAAGFAHRFRSAAERWGWTVGVACAAYPLTIAVNALRITLAVMLYEVEMPMDWLTAERVHRLAGTVTFLLALWAAWLAYDRVSAHLGRAASSADWSTLLATPAAYAALTIALPLANGAWTRFGARYVEHAVTVSVLTAATVALLSLTRWFTTSRRNGQTVDSGGRGRAGHR